MRNLRLTFFQPLSCFALFGCISLEAFAGGEPQDVSERYRRLLSLEVNETEEVKRIFKMADQLPPLSHEESLALVQEVSLELVEVFEKLNRQDLSSEQIGAFKAKGRDLISQLLAISLKSPNISNWVEAWLDRNRKSFILLSEALVVTAAIIGAEIALKQEAAGLNLFMQSFALSLGSVLAIILQARWLWHYQNKKNLNQALKMILEVYPSKDKNRISKELGYPKRIFDCAFVLSQWRKQRSESH